MANEHEDQLSVLMKNGERLRRQNGELLETLHEVVRLLGKVVPHDKTAMIKWAVESKDSVYTNAGAAYRIGLEDLSRYVT